MFFKTFSFRIMGIAFIGTHIPLLAVIFFFIFGPGRVFTPMEVITVTLLATLSAAIGTLLFVDKQIRPVRRAALALVGVRAGEATPAMPSSPSTELRQLFEAIDESYRSAAELTEQKRTVASRISRHVSQADQSRQIMLDKLAHSPNLAPADREKLYDDLHAESSSQIEDMRAILRDINGSTALAA